MSRETIPIANVSLNEDEIQAAVDVLKSGQLIQGEQVERFEQDFANSVGAENAIAVSSGTAALHVAYLATIDEGSEVLVPALSHVSTASMVSFAGGIPKICDVDEETYTIDISNAADRLTAQTDAIAPVHLFGNVCDIDTITNLAQDENLTIIWDAAQAHGAKYSGIDVGAFDDVVTYSFYPTKNMTTIEGGIITTDDPEIARQCRLLRSHWQTEKYYHPEIGLNYRMSDVEGAIGRKQLEKLDGFVDRRRQNAARLTEGLKAIKEINTQAVIEKAKHSYHQYTIQVTFDRLSCDRELFRRKLDQAGVETAVHYPRPLHHQPALEESISLPTSERICQQVVSLPVHPSIGTKEINHIVDSVSKTVDEFR